MSYIKFANVKYKLENKLFLKNVSFDIKDNKLCLIVNPSYVISNLIIGKIKPTSGIIMINDILINVIKKKERKNYLKNTISIIDDNDLLENLSVIENIELANNNNEDIYKYIRKVGLTKKINYYPSELSDIETHKAKLAMALIKKPEILIYNSIDKLNFKNQVKILKTIKNEYLKNNMIVIIESNKNDLAKACDEVITFNRNQIDKIKINKKPKKAGDLL